MIVRATVGNQDVSPPMSDADDDDDDDGDGSCIITKANDTAISGGVDGGKVHTMGKDIKGGNVPTIRVRGGVDGGNVPPLGGGVDGGNVHTMGNVPTMGGGVVGGATFPRLLVWVDPSYESRTHSCTSIR